MISLIRDFALNVSIVIVFLYTGTCNTPTGNMTLTPGGTLIRSGSNLTISLPNQLSGQNIPIQSKIVYLMYIIHGPGPLVLKPVTEMTHLKTDITHNGMEVFILSSFDRHYVLG